MKFTIFLKRIVLFSSFYCLFLYINKTLRLNNFKTRTATNAKISVFVICVNVIIYLLSYNLHDCTFNDPKTAPKTYWAILKTFVNGSKIPLIPPLLVDNKLVTDFLDKANLFKNFFTKQCTPISNDSTVPVSINFETMERLSSSEFRVDDIVKIIRPK